MKKILIIEDNQDVRENTADILELANYEVCTAENGKKGVALSKTANPDIILCDIMMPELDGYDVLQHLSKDKKTATMPFIFLTAKTERTDMRKGMNLGADDYLTKPFEESELLEAVETRLNKHNFLKKEFSKDIEGITQFFDEASSHDGMESLSKDRNETSYKKKELLFMEGYRAFTLYFIKTGAVKTYKTTELGKYLVTGIFGPGQFVGQLSLINKQGTYVDTAAALEQTEVVKIPKTDFTTLLYGNKQISNKFIEMISNDLISVQEKLINMAFSSVRQRLAKVLVDLNNSQTINISEYKGIDISREDLAGLIGTATETAIRMLTDFKDEGLVTIAERRRIILNNTKNLEDIVLFG